MKQLFKIRSNAIFAILLLTALFSCKKVADNDEPLICCAMIQDNVQVALQNKQGQNLLLESTPGHYLFKDMNLYFIREGKKILSTELSSSHSNAIRLIYAADSVRLSVSAYVLGKNDVISDVNGIRIGQSTALLELDKNTTDTIKTEWRNKGGNTWIAKTWHNGKLVIDTENQLSGFKYGTGFFIIK